MDTMKFGYSVSELDEARKLQREAYRWAAQIEARLQPGKTEKEIAEEVWAAQRAGGYHQVFHEPFVWIGPRTVLGADWAPADDVAQAANMGRTSPFFPTDEAIKENTPVIIDIAVVSAHGFPQDLGYSCIVGRNQVYDELLAGLQPMRSFLLQRVRRGETLKRIYEELNVLIADQGWENCHQHYPAHALGHLVPRLPPEPQRAPVIQGFGVAASEALATASLQAHRDHTCLPVWNVHPDADFPPTPGIWAVEPHIGKGKIGAKWEELLVVTDTDAYWLDDDLPHHRKWRGENPLAD